MSGEDDPFSASFLPAGQTVGRYDLHDRPPVRYLAGSAEHALGEALAPFRGTAFHPAFLRRSGHPFALVRITLAASLVKRIADVASPAVLVRHDVKPDDLAHHDRRVTQAIARRLHDAGRRTGNPAGLRWWSALTGAWHTTVVFTDREREGELVFGKPQTVSESDPTLLRALAVLGIRLPRQHRVRPKFKSMTADQPCKTLQH